MKRLSHRRCLATLAVAGLLSATAPAPAETIYSAGSTLTAGLYRQWLDTLGTPLNGPCLVTGGTPTSDIYAYAGVGSSAGIAGFLNQTSPTASPTAPICNGVQHWQNPAQGVVYPYPRLDFAGSAAPLTDAQIAMYNASVRPVRGPAIQVPAVAAAVTIPFNPTGLNINSGNPLPAGATSRLRLSRASYCGIFTGAITNWGHSSLTIDNGGIVLSAQPIKVIIRADSSGTTYLLTRHLQAVCNGSAAAGGFTWTAGAGTTVMWPVVPGSFIAMSGSAGMAAAVVTNQFTIGYVGPDYTQMIPAPWISPAPVVANLQNQGDITGGLTTPHAPTVASTAAGVSGFVLPTVNDAQHWSAAANGGIVSGGTGHDDGTQVIPTTSANRMRNPTAASAYPIVGFALFDFYTCYATTARTNAIRTFVNWYTAGGLLPTPRNGFAALSATVNSGVRSFATSATGLRTGPVAGVCSM